jgi:transposase
MERIHMNIYTEIIYRLREKESERSISRDLGISRPTVHKYKLKALLEGYLDSQKELPEREEIAKSLGPDPQPPKTPSTVEGYQEAVQKYLKQGLEMTAIFQRLRDDYGYQGSYSSVRRFVHHVRPEEKEAYVRVHSEPGEELQVDFGSIGLIYDPKAGKMRKGHVFVATLGYSRHQYAEIVCDQKTSTWLGLHQRALAFFGGVPRRVVLDNLKAAVVKALVLDPILGEAYRKLAQHYHFLISPNRPGTPRHKGKVENGVNYVKRNFFAGQEFVDLERANLRLKAWVMETAGVREHGTTHQAPLKLFRETEQAALQALPAESFDLHAILMAKVHSDCHIVVDGSFYSVFHTLVGSEVEVHVHERVVEIYAHHELVRTHRRATQKGQWRTEMEDYPPSKAQYLLKTPQFCLKLALRMGSHTHQVVEHLLADRPLDRLRSVQAILGLAESVGQNRLEAACRRALYYGDPHYRRIKDILNAALDREPLPDQVVAAPTQQSFAFSRKPREFFEHKREGQP